MKLGLAGLAVAAGALLLTWQLTGRHGDTIAAGDADAQQTGAPAPAAQAGLRFDADRAFGHLKDMVGLGPRPSGSPAIHRTRAYITRQLTEAGLTVQEQPFVARTPRGPIEMVNLVVRLPGRRTDRILFTGHYDTKLMPAAQNFVGASDGASSAAFLIELARALKASPAHEFTYELVWFDGEEAVVEWSGDDHTYGSQHYVNAATQAGALTSIKAMILVDMIGDRDLQIRRDTNSTRWLTDTIWEAAKRLNLDSYFVSESTRIEDDHLPFVQAGVPAVDIIDLDYQPWHTANDTLDAVSARSLQVVGDVVLAALPQIEARFAKGQPSSGRRNR
jgi:glutaminyl-peptide cyclotransferase